MATRAGAGAQARGNDLELVAMLWFTAAFGLAYLALYKLHGVPAQLLGGVAIALALVGVVRRESARRWQWGAGGERRVGRALRPLERRGWLVLHDLMKPRGGNVDHLVAGPGGAFTIETKLKRFGKRELAQARAHAAWAAKRLGVPVVPVLCVATSNARPKLYAGVWVMGPGRLRHWLSQGHMAAVDVAAAEARLSPSAER